MAERRLIDANKLCEGMVSNDPVVIAAKCAPTVDAVEVVRCKDCLNATPLCGIAKKYFEEECLICEMGRGDPALGYSIVLTDGFCSDGVRRDEKED